METSISEKFEASVNLGLLNTRMKDYFDLWHLARNFAFDGQSISESNSSHFQAAEYAIADRCTGGHDRGVLE